MADQSYFGGSDPMNGAKRHKQVVVNINEAKEESKPAQDITQSEMFLKLFGAETVKQFQKLEAKSQREKPIVRDLGLKNKGANKESENKLSDSKIETKEEEPIKQETKPQEGETNMKKDENDLDSVFEDEESVESTEDSTKTDDSESDPDIIESYMAYDGDEYKESIENINQEDDKDLDLILPDENEEEKPETVELPETKPEEKPVIQSAEDYMSEVEGDFDYDEGDNAKDEPEENESTPTEDFKDEETEDESEESEPEESEEEILNSMVEPEVEKAQEKTIEEKKDISKAAFDIDDVDDDDEAGEIVEETVSHPQESEEIKPEEPEEYKDDGSYSGFKKDAFWKSYREYQDKYSEKSLVEYLDRFMNDEKDDYGTILKEYYNETIIKYGEVIDFQKDEWAKNQAWIIAAGKLADFIERRKSMGIIDSSVEVINLGKDGTKDIVEDPNIVTIMKERQAHKEKVNKYAIDRTVFAIADDESEEDASIFEDKKAVDKEFYESPFYKILKEVMTSDRCADMSHIYMKVIINPDTSFIPIVDFSSGIRFVCIDSSDVDQYRIHALALARSVPFSFSGKRRNEIRTRVLYSDMCLKRPVATIFAMKKLIAFDCWNKKHIVSLQHNYAVAYTTENQYVEMFENGDPDSKNPENCVNITRKPKTCSLGIIALDKKSQRDRQAMRRKQGKRVLERMANGGWYNDQDVNFNDYDIHFVLGVDIIANDRDLVNPAIPQEERCVHYQITRYCECNSVIILDGLQTICTCIVKEHFKKYGRGTKYSIEFEYDPTELLSPGVMALIDNHDGVEESTYKRSNPMSIMSTYIMPPSRLKMEGVFEFEKGRIDPRNFNAATLSVNYPRELWSRYQIQTNEGRAEFLRSRGFEEFWQPATAVFDIMPYVLKIIETGSFINEICDVNISTLSDRDSTDVGNLLYQQQKLEYVKKLDNSGYGGFQKFLLGVLDFLIDSSQINK